MSEHTELLPEPLPPEPLTLAADWLAQAWKRAPAAESQCHGAGHRQCRTGALRRASCCARTSGPTPGFIVFYTNYQSRKGRELAANARAAVVMHWDHLHRQVRVEGRVVKAPDADSDAYFASRALESRIGAWASQQSQPVASRAAAARCGRRCAKRLGAIRDGRGQVPVPRPPHWGGFRLWADAVELWVEGDARIHDRARWTRTLTARGEGDSKRARGPRPACSLDGTSSPRVEDHPDHGALAGAGRRRGHAPGSTSVRTTSWKQTLWVGIFPMNGDGSEVSDALRARPARPRISPASRRSSRAEAARYGVTLDAARCASSCTRRPQSAARCSTRGSGPLAAMWWSLKMRWYARQRRRRAGARALAHPRVRAVSRSRGERDACRIRSACRRDSSASCMPLRIARCAAQNTIVIAHETMHTVGATDKYDLSTGEPVYPDGYAEPDRSPRFPQPKAEIMAGQRPVSRDRARDARRPSRSSRRAQDRAGDRVDCTSERGDIDGGSRRHARGLARSLGIRAGTRAARRGDVHGISRRRVHGDSRAQRQRQDAHAAHARGPARAATRVVRLDGDAAAIAGPARDRATARRADAGPRGVVHDDGARSRCSSAVIPHLRSWQWEGARTSGSRARRSPACGWMTSAERTHGNPLRWRAAARGHRVAAGAGSRRSSCSTSRRIISIRITRSRCWSCFATQANAGRTVIATLHDPTLAARFADRVILLFGDGRWRRRRRARDAHEREALTELYLTPMLEIAAHGHRVFVSA